MVSLRFYLNRTLESPHFDKSLGNLMKVSRLILEDLKIHEENIGKEMGAKF